MTTCHPDTERFTMITYTASLAGLGARRLHGFFVGWPDPPDPDTLLRLLHASDHVEIAIAGPDRHDGPVVGFATSLTDGILTADLTYLEVLPPYQSRGIGTALVRRTLAHFHTLYAVNVTCDPTLEPFYRRLGLSPARAMILRNYPRQSGA